MNTNQYALNFKGAMMLAADQWREAVDTPSSWGRSEFDEGLRTGKARALSIILQHATGRRKYEEWVEAIVAMDPIGANGWPAAEAAAKVGER